MKKRMFSLLLFSTLVLLKTAHAGPRVGNGGAGWLCSSEEKVFWLSTLDLYEASHEFHLTPLEFTTAAFDEIIHTLSLRLQKIEEFENYNFHHYLEEVRTGFTLVDSNDLTAIDDNLVRVVPNGRACPHGDISKVQIANMTFDGRLIIDKDLWQLLPATEQAALIFHEAFYKLFRDLYNDQDSTRARRVVGPLFSEMPLADLKKHLVSSRQNLFSLVDMSPLANILINSNFNDFINANLVNYCQKILCPEGTKFSFSSVTLRPVQTSAAATIHSFHFTYAIDNLATECQFLVDYTTSPRQLEHTISKILFDCH